MQKFALDLRPTSRVRRNYWQQAVGSALLVAVSMAGCSNDNADVDVGKSRPTCGADAAATRSMGSAEAGAVAGCNNDLPGPPLVEIPAPDGSSYCVDATEVTNADYAQFLAVGPSICGQLPECAWNTSYVPGGWPATGKDNYPVAGVDWCDAYAYCQWAGKRLCGRIGGGANAYSDYANAALSQWYNACSAGGTKKYPYGNTYSSFACVQTGFTTPTAPVGSRTGCEGGYPGLFDMIGNVLEWEDSCEGATGRGDFCGFRGAGSCDYQTPNDRSLQAEWIGIRCCTG